MSRGYAEARRSPKLREAHARAFCALVVSSYWAERCDRHQVRLKIKTLPFALPALAVDVRSVAEATGRLIAEFPVEDAGYMIGSIYTGMLPPTVRSERGAYYTPPPLVKRLLDLAEEAGFDPARHTAVDPACGGGAFLAPLALRIVERSQAASPEWILARIAKQLKGIELDPFAAWVSTVLLEVAVLPLCISARRRMPDVVEVANALDPRAHAVYDLVIGNPPYGRITLSEEMRTAYARSLFGHANLYGVFTDLALRLLKPGGVLAFLTPTSFLGGQYFKNLRLLLTTEATPIAFDFVSDREGVFEDVLQETLLTTYVKGSSKRAAQVSLLEPKGLNSAMVTRLGSRSINRSGDPWLLPRSASDRKFLSALSGMRTRLGDLGYTVSTGPLVWNRHKDQLRSSLGPNTFPLIWAEAVTADGFRFSSDRRNHAPFFRIAPNQQHFVCSNSCVLVQRTTSKEQTRRLLAAVVPQQFLDQHGGAIVENHVNMVRASDRSPLSPKTIAAVLNSEAADRAFRCISGSVAVSAYELSSIPLPPIDRLIELQRMIHGDAPPDAIQREISHCYGLD